MITAPNFAGLDWLVHGFGLRGSVYPAHITTIRQIHSAIVVDAAGRRGNESNERLETEGDALISGENGVIVGVRTADCVPILIVDPVTRAVAAIHAGWRGTAAKISVATVQALAKRWGTVPANLRAAIGPSIGPCCFEVGPEVALHFGIHTTEKVHLDLKAENEKQLRACGVVNIWKSGECTVCARDRFFSYRREREEAGRMISFIGS